MKERERGRAHPAVLKGFCKLGTGKSTSLPWQAEMLCQQHLTVGWGDPLIEELPLVYSADWQVLGSGATCLVHWS